MVQMKDNLSHNIKVTHCQSKNKENKKPKKNVVGDFAKNYSAKKGTKN